ncbi:MAG: radical SAM protein [Nitrospirae bacterium]|nr:radical SAM protein [Nitrospirota bacterium]
MTSQTDSITYQGIDRTGEAAVPVYPKSVILETTNLCNLKCKMCHVWGEGVSQKRETGFMPESIWKKAIDELSAWPEAVNVALHGAGEALLHKDFLKILTYATSKKNLSVGFLSNGALLTRELAERIMATDIAWIGFSVDGAQEEKYNKYRGTDLRKVESAIEYLLTLRRGKKPVVFVNMVALPDIDSELFVQRWVDKVDEVKVSRYRPAGHRDFLTEKIERIPCHLLDEMLVIAWNGQAALCCEDIWADVALGKFPEESLYELWHSQRLNKVRDLHRMGRYGDIPLCSDCDSWSNTLTSTELRESENLKLTKCAAQTSYQRIKETSPAANEDSIPAG